MQTWVFFKPTTQDYYLFFFSYIPTKQTVGTTHKLFTPKRTPNNQIIMQTNYKIIKTLTIKLQYTQLQKKSS